MGSLLEKQEEISRRRLSKHGPAGHQKKRAPQDPKTEGKNRPERGDFCLYFFSFLLYMSNIYLYILRIYFLFFFCVTFLLFFISFLFFFELPQKPSFITPYNPYDSRGLCKIILIFFLILFVTFVDRNCVMWYNYSRQL